jgi:hypothetical protein
MTRIYRWQDKEGRGPYRAGLPLYWADADHDERNPAFFAEFGLAIVQQAGYREHLGCGFLDVAQMLRWFTPLERNRLTVLGYEFGCLQADKILASSERQLVFARAKSLREGFQLCGAAA